MHATDTEATQIKKYARAIVADLHFADMRPQWDFFLLVTDDDESVRGDIDQEVRPSGGLDQSRKNPSSPVNYRIWAKKWSEVLDKAKRRLDFYQHMLNRVPTLNDVRAHLTENHRDGVLHGHSPENEALVG